MGDIRKIYQRIISCNPENNKVDQLAAKGEHHKLTDDGCVESFYTDEKSHCACGCFALPGGRCAEVGCGRISCIRCHQHCGGSDNQTTAGCGKPICREHSNYLQLPEGRTIPFCRQCYSRLVRKQRWLLVGRTFVQFFIDDKEQHRE